MKSVDPPVSRLLSNSISHFSNHGAIQAAIFSSPSSFVPSEDHPAANGTSFEFGSCSRVNIRSFILAGIADASPTNNASCLSSDDSLVATTEFSSYLRDYPARTENHALDRNCYSTVERSMSCTARSQFPLYLPGIVILTLTRVHTFVLRVQFYALHFE